MRTKARKLMWSVPLIATVAVIGALAVFMTLAPGALFANELPNNPQNLKVKAADGNAGRTALVLTWDAPAGGPTPTGYRIDVSTDNDEYKFLAMTNANTLTYTNSGIKGSTSGVMRFYRVFAMNSHGAGAVSTWESATTKDITMPGQVMSFTASSNDPTMVQLTWTAPENGGADILGYCILAFGPADTGTLGSVSDTNCLEMLQSDGPGTTDAIANAADSGDVIRIAPAAMYTHKKLRAKQAWYYRVYAVNEHGHSATASATRNVTTAGANDPTRPGNLLVLQDEVTGDVPEVVHLYWTKPDDGGQDVLRYRVEVSDKANYWPSADAPAAVDAVERAATKDIADDTGDPAVIHANVAIIHVGDGQPSTVVSYDLQHTVALGADTKLYYRVRTETDADGNAATTGDTKTSGYITGSVTVVDVAAQLGFDAPIPAPRLADGPEDGTPGQIDIAITDNPANSYRVDVSADDGITWDMVHSATRPIDEGTYEHEGLKPAVSRHFRLFGKKGSDYGLASNVLLDTSGHSKSPDAVGNLMATSDGAGKINLSWDAPSSDNGSEIVKYCIVANRISDSNVVLGTQEVERTDIDTTGATDGFACAKLGDPATSPVTLSENQVIQVAPSSTSVVFKGLEQKTRWQFGVFALNAATDTSQTAPVGVALSSDTVSAKTGAAMVPMMPANLSAEVARDTNVAGTGSRGVLLLWNAPADPDGAKVTGYKIERSINGGDYSVRMENMPANRTYWVDLLELDTNTHVYRVTSRNAVGPGTEMATVMIPLADHTTHTPDVPDTSTLTAPTDVTATSNAAGMVTVSWTDGENAPGGHLVLLFTGDFTEVPGIEVPADGTNTQSFTNIAAGEYVAVVVSIKSRSEYLYDYSLVTVN